MKNELLPVAPDYQYDRLNMFLAALIRRKEVTTIKILCGDDNQSILHLYQDELSDEGYKVVVSDEGKEVLRKFKKESPEGVVLDIRMPGMNGIEILNAILGKNRQALVILHTAYPQDRQNFMT